VLTPLDETLAHQTPNSFDQVYTSDHRFFDRDWFSANHPEGDVGLITGMAAYSNMNVMDGFMAVQHQNRQYNVRVSRQLRPASQEMRIGPLVHESIEPLWATRLSLDAGDYSVSCDLRWEGILPAHEEPHHFLRRNGRVVQDYRRYDQCGRVSGWIRIGEERFEADDWWGARDHSWGVRSGVGGWEPGLTSAVKAAGAHEDMFVWLEFATGRLSGHVQFLEAAGGHHGELHGFVCRRDDPQLHRDQVVAADIALDLIAGTQAYRRAVLRLTVAGGAAFEIDATPLHTAWAYRGTGYNKGFSDGGGLGAYRGPLLVEHDVYDVSDPERVVLFPHGEAIAAGHREQPVRLVVNGEPGFGHFPIMFLPPT
jgi:hypothetical protein